MTTYMPRSVRSRLTRGVLFAVALVVSMLIFTGTAAASVPCGHGVEDDGANVYLVEYFCDEDTGAVVTIKRTKIGPSPPGPKPSPPGNDFPKIGPPAQVVLPVPIPAPVPAPVPVPAPALVPGISGACIASYVVTVVMDPARPTTLLMDFGDTGVYGYSETRTIPQGTGPVTLRFTHEFNPSVFKLEPVMVQQATVIETGASGRAVTLHPQIRPQDPEPPTM